MGKHAGNRGRSQGFRATESAWESFLVALETRSAVEVSKLPGMPSTVAFQKKRARDRAFDRRAAEIMAARKLLNGGRKRITAAQWGAFIARVGSCCISELCKEPGMPSESVVHKRRNTDDAFAAELLRSQRARCEMRLQAALKARGHRYAPPAERLARLRTAPAPQAPLAERMHSNDLYAAALAVVPRFSPEDRDDIAADLVLAMLEGDLAVHDLQERAPEYVRRHFRLFSRKRDVSLDAPAFPGARVSLIETIPDQPASCVA